MERTEFDAKARRLDLTLDFFQHQAFLHARVPRVRCPVCGVRQVQVPWARPGSGFTVRFEALVPQLAKEMPVGRLIGENDTYDM